MAKILQQTLLASLIVPALAACGGGGGGSDSSSSSNSSNPQLAITAPSSTNIVKDSEFSISWQSTNTSTCTASGGWSGDKSVSGTEVMSEATLGEKTYSLSCSGEGASVSDSVTLNIVNLPALTFESSVEEVPVDSSFELSWNATDADECVAGGDWSGVKASAGTESLIEIEAGDKRYELTCTGPGGRVSENVSLTVLNSPTVVLTSSSFSVKADTEFELSWLAEQADTCIASGDWSGTKAVSGTELFVESDIGTNTYNIECSGTLGTVSESITVEITNPLTVSLSVSVEEAPAGVDFIISWASTDADSCAASGDWAGNKSLEGTETLNVVNSSEQNYFLTCTGVRGNVEDSAAVSIFDYQVDKYHGTQIPDFVGAGPSDVEYFQATVNTTGQLEGLQHQQTAEFGAGKFVFNRVYRAVKHGVANWQQFGIFGSWLHSYDNNSIEGGLWVNPKTTGPQYYPSLHLAGIGDTYYACNDVTMGGGLYEKVLGDRWLTQIQISNQVLTIPGMDIGFDMNQENYPQDNGIWIGSGWSYLNLDHPREFKFWMSFIESHDYQGPINGYIPEHFNWVDPEKVDEGSYAYRKDAAGDRFGTFATHGSSPNGGNGNERVSFQALDLGNDIYYMPTDHLPVEKSREYLLAYPQSIEQSTMEAYSEALKSDTLSDTLIAADTKNFQSVYRSSHNQLRMVEEVAGEEHLHMIVPNYEVGYSGALGFVDWDFSTEAKKTKIQDENGYIYIRKLDEKWQVEQYADSYYTDHPHIYKTELVDAPDDVIRAPEIEHKFYNYKERDTSNPEFANWDTTGMKRHQVLLQNGAIATFVWFKFTEQPAFKTAKQNHPEVYTDEYLATVQTYIEKLHQKVSSASTTNPKSPVFMQYSEIEGGDSSNFNLAKIDPAQLVSPEQDKLVGYVPVVISVYHPEEFSMNGIGLEAEPSDICANEDWTDTYHLDIE